VHFVLLATGLRGTGLETSRGSRRRSASATVALPAVGSSSVVSIRSVVVFPAP
jgi:hypothetical protein